jgi:reverse gyrase
MQKKKTKKVYESTLCFIEKLQRANDNPLSMSSETKFENQKEALKRFYNLIEDQHFYPTPVQQKFIEAIFMNESFITMTACRTGKSTLFKWIDNFMTYGKLSPL